MQVGVFVSGGSWTLRACLDTQERLPELLCISLVVSDHLHLPAIDFARSQGIAVICQDFESVCGRWRDSCGNIESQKYYRDAANLFHDRILEEIQAFEKDHARLDLIVLSYHRWIHGRLLDYFRDRMVNQHPGDLTVLRSDGGRALKGLRPVPTALKSGARRTRTTTMLVTDGHDDGEILCQGPWVTFDQQTLTPESAWAHERRQKQESDWPCVGFALREIALGNLGISAALMHPEGGRVLTYGGRPLVYGGVDLAKSVADCCYCPGS